VRLRRGKADANVGDESRLIGESIALTRSRFFLDASGDHARSHVAIDSAISRQIA